MNNLTKTCLAAFVLCGMLNALTVSFTANRAYADIGQNLTLLATASGGTAPYTFEFFHANATTGNTIGYFNNAYTASLPVHLKQAGTANYLLRVYDYNWLNETNATISLTVNASPVLALAPKNITTQPYTSVMFSNTVTGGTPPYSNYSIDVEGVNSAGLSNNIVAVNGTGLYLVTEVARDLLGRQAKGSALIDVALAPTVATTANCQIINNFSQTEVVPLTVGWNATSVVENYITPDYAGVTIGTNSITIYPNNAFVYGGSGYYVRLLNLSWIPILQTISIAICPAVAVAPVGTTTTSSTTTTTTPTSSSTSSTSTTTLATTTTAQPVSTTTVNAASVANPATPISLKKELAIIACVVAAAIFSAYVFLWYKKLLP